jgi:hypothetical protein
MGPAAQVVSSDVVLAACGALVLCLAASLWLLLRGVRGRRAVVVAELSRSRTEVESLHRKVEELADQVARARRDAERDREYVITSLAGDQDTRTSPPAGAMERPVLEPARPPVGQLIEDQLVGALARRPSSSPVRARAVELVVRTVSVGHGLRRALSPDVLDRAAAEAHVARRRSRRDRRRELRRARRLVRAASTSPAQRTGRHDQEVA